MKKNTTRHDFWLKAKIPDDCWEWQEGLSDPGQYGKTTRDDISDYAHRVAWELFHNEKIPDGMCVLHKCDNSKCINPFHLFLGTKGQNNTDRAQKGRNANVTGEQHPNAKLDELQVKQMRELYATGNYTHKSLSVIFFVSPATVGKIVRNERWSK